MATNIPKVPATHAPWDVSIVLILLTLAFVAGGGFLFYLLIGKYGFLIPLIVLAFTTGVYTEGVPEFRALTLLNHFSHQQRAVFQGLHFKLPWESAGTMVDVRADLSDVCNETWTTKEGALMQAKYVYIMRPVLTPEAIILYAGYEPDTVKKSGRALFSKMFSDHFGKEVPGNLLDKEKVNNEVLAKGKAKLADFSTAHGVQVSLVLEDVDFDKETQKARNMITNAKSYGDAVAMLMADRVDEVTKAKIPGTGMARENAEFVASMMNLPGMQKYILEVHGLENLQSVNIAGGLGMPKNKGTTPKGGSHK